jgi:hypothetical protein
MDRQMASPISSEPEMEVPSVVDERKERRDEELSDGTQEFLSITCNELREAEQPPCETKVPFDDSGFHGLGAGEDSKLGDFDFGSQFTWSDDDDSEAEGFGLNFYDSILAIRKEASMINAVMAVDQLDTLKGEMRSMRRELSDRTAEIEELHALIQFKDNRIGTLELERDLYKADTNKLANDLESCLLKLRIIGQAPNTLYDHTNQDLIIDEPSKKVNDPTPFSSAGEAPLAPLNNCITSQPDRSKGRLDPPSLVDSSHTAASRTTVTASTISRSVISPEPIPLFEKPRVTTGSKRVNRVESRPRQANDRPFALCRNVSQKEIAVPVPKETETHGILQEQVQEMSQRLKVSVETSEELRRRLAKLNRYYESLVRHLQDTLIEIKTDRAQIEFDLTRQISTIDREYKSALAEMESTMQEQDEELRIHRVQTRVITSDG